MAISSIFAIALIVALWVVLRPKKVNSLIRLPIKRKGAISVNRFDELVEKVGTVAARKLVRENLERYPDRSPSWACNKAISDLEKQRRL